MTTPSPIPEKSTSGISVDPKTLNRVVPESRRRDGRCVHYALAFTLFRSNCLYVFYSIRKEIKIRPGYTPREDLTRFRGTRQAQMDRVALPEGHILGWVAPSSASKPKSSEPDGPASKSGKKNEKRKGKRDKKKEEIIRANWEEEEAEDVVKDADGVPNWAETAKTQERGPKPNKPEEEAEADDVVKDADGVPNLAETAKAQESWPKPSKHEEEAEAEDVVKDADGVPNWAETAKAQARRSKLSKPENKAAGDEDQPLAADEADGVGKPPALGAEDIGDKLKHLEI
jgi:partner of Y14 and mago